MVEDIEPKSDKNEMERSGEEFFNEVATVTPVRKVEMPEMGGVTRSRAEAEEEPVDLSDLKATLNRLFPRIPVDKIDRVVRSAMVARISPDVFQDIIGLTVTDIVEMWDEEYDGELDVQEVINMVYFTFSIGLDGKGRLDAIQILSNTTESGSKELSAMSNIMGG